MTVTTVKTVRNATTLFAGIDHFHQEDPRALPLFCTDVIPTGKHFVGFLCFFIVPLSEGRLSEGETPCTYFCFL